MEPGTFKDRLLLERNPHQLIEGMIVAGFAIEADIAFIFMRGEYTLAAERVERAITEAYERHYLGKNILNSGYNLELYLHLSGGRYICGDETGLLNALEGKRANPRAKPPFPPVVGLFGKPTVVNNVETLSCVPHIINNGAAWFRGLGRTKDAGTKFLRSTRVECATDSNSVACCLAALPPILSSKSIWTRPWILPQWRKWEAGWAPAP
jgi:NADH-quinone oxidoreductase subunit F